VHVETDMRVTGPAAQFGRGVMQDVSAKLMGRFADCLAEEISGAAPPAAEEAGGAATGGTAAAGAQTASQPTGETPSSAPAPEGARVVGPINPAADPPPGPAGESAARAAQPAGAGASGTAAGAAARPRRSEEVLDLGEASREAVLKRVVPVAAAMVGLIVLLGIRRRRR